MPDLILGPLLRYTGSTQATVWVETGGPCVVSILDARQRTFQIVGQKIRKEEHHRPMREQLLFANPLRRPASSLMREQLHTTIAYYPSLGDAMITAVQGHLMMTSPDTFVRTLLELGA